MTVQKSPFFVILTRNKNGDTFAWGGNSSRARCERIIKNPFAMKAGRWTQIVEFSSAEAAWEEHGDALDIAHPRMRSSLGSK